MHPLFNSAVHFILIHRVRIHFINPLSRPSFLVIVVGNAMAKNYHNVDRDFSSPLSTQKQLTSVKEVIKSLQLAVMKNDQLSTRLSEIYERKITEQLNRRKYVWTEVFMSSLSEDQSFTLSNEQCASNLVDSFHEHCGYFYPMDDYLRSVIQSLCRNRKSEGKLIISFEQMCIV